MKAVEFCYWLQGHFELSGQSELTPFQVQQIKNHLSLVFKHEIDPSYTNLDPASAQAIHDQKPPSHKFQIGGTDGNGNVYRC